MLHNFITEQKRYFYQTTINTEMIQEALNAVELKWETVSLKRGDFLIQAGKVEKYIYFVREGALRAYILTEDGEFTIRFGYKNSIITALPSYFTNEPTELYIEAIRKCELARTTKVLFNEYVNSTKERLMAYQLILEDLISSFLAREVDLLTQSPRIRYERLKQRSPQVFQEIPHKYIASYLRMSPETLSRLKKS